MRLSFHEHEESFISGDMDALGDINPLEALRKGKVEEVNRVAAAFVEEASR